MVKTMTTLSPIEATCPAEIVSSRYQFHSTEDVIKTFDDMGYELTKIIETRTSDPKRKGFQKHHITFRKGDQPTIVGDSVLAMGNNGVLDIQARTLIHVLLKLSIRLFSLSLLPVTILLTSLVGSCPKVSDVTSPQNLLSFALGFFLSVKLSIQTLTAGSAPNATAIRVTRFG